MRKTRVALALLVTGLATGFLEGPTKPLIADDDTDGKISIRDDCDPTDPGWTPTGGCALEEGDVNLAEFNAELANPPSLSAAVIGHQAWRNDPPYLEIETDETVRVRKRVPPLRRGLTPAPECLPPATVTDLAPGARVKLTGLSPGNHRFMCCIHPWMRAIIKVKEEEEEEEDR